MVVDTKKRLKKLLPVLIILVLIIGGFLYLKSKNGVTTVTASKAEVRSVSKTISTSGETGVSEGYTTRALVGGNIKEVKFKSGDSVKKGDTVIEMNQASLKASLDTAYSTYLSAKADFDSYDQRIVAAKSTVSSEERERDAAWRTYMGDNGESNKQAYKTAEAAYQSALSSLKILEDDKKATQNTVYSTYSSYFSALNNYQNSTITAPEDGKLALADIYQGSLVTAGQELFSITSSKSLIFKAEIDEADISHIKAGMKAGLELDSYPGKTFEGVVENVDTKVQTLSSGSTVIIADISFDSSEVLPILGLSGSAGIEFDKTEGAVSVSVDSILDDLDKKYVYVVTGDVAYKKEVTIGLEGDDYVVVALGVSEGDLIITNADDYKLKDGQKVKL